MLALDVHSDEVLHFLPQLPEYICFLQFRHRRCGVLPRPVGEERDEPARHHRGEQGHSGGRPGQSSNSAADPRPGRNSDEAVWPSMLDDFEAQV